jgi:hypothetical protein
MYPVRFTASAMWCETPEGTQIFSDEAVTLPTDTRSPVTAGPD